MQKCSCGKISTCDACALRWLRSLSAPMLETALDAVESPGDGGRYPLLESNESCIPGRTYLISEVTGTILPGGATVSRGIVEGTEQRPGGPLVFHGKFQEANATNKNKRRYTMETLRRQTEKLAPMAAERGLYGELDHPTDAVIHFADASHLNLGFEWHGSVLHGRAEVIPTPAGRILEAVFRARGKVGVSSRGLGAGIMCPDGVLEIGDNYNMITYDAVCDPSTHQAYQAIAEAAGLGRAHARTVGHIAESLAAGDNERANALVQETLRHDLPNLPAGEVNSVCLSSKNSERAAAEIVNFFKLMTLSS